MRSDLVLVEDPAALQSMNPLASPRARLSLFMAGPVAVGSAVYARIQLGLAWALILPLACAVTAVAVLAAIFIPRLFPQTWWFRGDCIHVERGPFSRRIPWEAIQSWQLTAASVDPDGQFLTVWYGEGGEQRSNTILVPRDLPAARIEEQLQSYRRAG